MCAEAQRQGIDKLRIAKAKNGKAPSRKAKARQYSEWNGKGNASRSEETSGNGNVLKILDKQRHSTDKQRYSLAKQRRRIVQRCAEKNSKNERDNERWKQ